MDSAYRLAKRHALLSPVNDTILVETKFEHSVNSLFTLFFIPCFKNK